jgi:hypothetical protein
MKKIYIISLLLLLFSCSPKITERIVYKKYIGKCQECTYSRTSWDVFGITRVVTDSLCLIVGGRAEIAKETPCYIRCKKESQCAKNKGLLEANGKTFIINLNY